MERVDPEHPQTPPARSDSLGVPASGLPVRVGEAPPTVAGPLGERPPAWPVTLGVFSIVLGSLGAVKNGCTGISGIAQGAFGMGGLRSSLTGGLGFGGWSIASAVISLVSMGVSVWLLLAGVKLLKKKVSSVSMHRSWAWTRIALALVELGLGVAGWAVVFGSGQSSGAPGGGAVVVGFGVLAMAVSLAISLAYPIVVLWVLSRPWAQREVRRWAEVCAGCGYSTLGLPTGAPCPECGMSGRMCPGAGASGASHAAG